MNAKEARKLSEKAKEINIAKIYNKLIEDAAERGNFSVRIDGFLDAFTKKTLEDYGYKVTDCDIGLWTEISW